MAQVPEATGEPSLLLGPGGPGSRQHEAIISLEMYRRIKDRLNGVNRSPKAAT
jgi:hypothetical protein